MEMPAEYLIQAPRADVDGHQNGIAALRCLLELNRPPDGIFCYNDVIAMGVIAEALSQGIAVPKDMAVIGCGNLHYSSEIRVPLSSIDQRSGEIGQRAARLILDILAAKADKTTSRLPRNHPAAAHHRAGLDRKNCRPLNRRNQRQAASEAAASGNHRKAGKIPDTNDGRCPRTSITAIHLLSPLKGSGKR